MSVPGPIDPAEGYDRALAEVFGCLTPEGFIASPTGVNNYGHVWSRDGVIIGLAGLMTGETELIDGLRNTLETLAAHQGPHGEIPSNVRGGDGAVSYGGTVGRVDADLWFAIGCGQYVRATGDRAFANRMWPTLERLRYLLGAWEFNNRGLLYVPPTGDWADEFIHSGYVLYDQALYLQAQREFVAIGRWLHGDEQEQAVERMERLHRLLLGNYWLTEDNGADEADIYHRALYERGLAAAPEVAGRYWAPTFSPTGYGYRFDSFANVLVSLLGIADDERADQVHEFIEDDVRRPHVAVLPAFHPAIGPGDSDWEQLESAFTFVFRNLPDAYHNGGLWPMITGFHVADLAARGKREQAGVWLNGIHRANAMTHEGEAWSFPEYVHGRTAEPGGTMHQGWSASAALMGHHALVDGTPAIRTELEIAL